MAQMNLDELQGMLESVNRFDHGLNITNSVRVLEAFIDLQAKFDRMTSCR